MSHTARVFMELIRKVPRKQDAYQWRPSSHSLREQHDRNNLLVRRMVAEGNAADLRCLEPESEDGKLLNEAWKAYDQRKSIRHTSLGDFCHLHTGSHEVK